MIDHSMREGKPTTPAALEVLRHNLTLPLLGFKCTLYGIKSRDMNEKGKDFISYNKPYKYAFSRPSWSIAHGVCTQSLLPAPTLSLDLHAHTQWHCLLLPGKRGGGVHVLKYILLNPFE